MDRMAQSTPVSQMSQGMNPCPVWVPVMMMPRNVMSTPVSPMLMSGQCTPSPIMFSGQCTPNPMMMGMTMRGAMMQPGIMNPMAAGTMTPVPAGVLTPPLSAGASTPPLQKPVDNSMSSTAFPSGSEAPSNEDADEDTTEACNELIAQLEAGGEARAAAMEAICGSVMDLAFDGHACRVVQKALDTATPEVAAALARELRGRIRDASKCPHANHVVQRLLDLLPAAESYFVVEEICGAATELSRHRFGSRVVCRAVRQHGALPAAEPLLNELMQEVLEMSRHTFAHYVVEALLDVSAACRREICAALLPEVVRHAKNRSATYIVEKALLVSDSEDVDKLAGVLFSSPEALSDLAENQFGCHLAKVLPRLPNHFKRAQAFMPQTAALLQKTKFGRRVLQEFRKHMSD